MRHKKKKISSATLFIILNHITSPSSTNILGVSLPFDCIYSFKIEFIKLALNKTTKQQNNLRAEKSNTALPRSKDTTSDGDNSQDNPDLQRPMRWTGLEANSSLAFRFVFELLLDFFSSCPNLESIILFYFIF
jgi:hypothetical protein